MDVSDYKQILGNKKLSAPGGKLLSIIERNFLEDLVKCFEISNSVPSVYELQLRSNGLSFALVRHHES